MNATKLITLLVTEHAWTVKQPTMASACFKASKIARGDSFLVAVIHRLMQERGDWKAVADWLVQKKFDLSRVDKFRAWCRELTAPKKRGLMLGWNGGAV